MASNNVSLGELIHQVGERNKELLSTDPLGVSIDKEFMPSVANTVGTDLSKYMLLRRNRFACNPMHVGRDRALPIARYKKDVPGIVSPAYMTFEADEDRVDLDYLELFFKLAVFNKECWFYTDSSVRGGLSWDALCSIELNLPSFDEQRKIAAITKVIRGRMAQLAEQNDYLSEAAKTIFERWLANAEGERVSVSEIADLNPDTYSPKEKWPLVQYLDTGSITRGTISGFQVIEPAIEKLPSRARRKVQSGDVVYSTVRPNQEHYGILLKPDANVLVSTGFTVVRSKNKYVCPEVLYLFLTQDKLTKGLQQIAEQSVSTYPSIKADDFGALEMPLPTEVEAKNLQAALGALFELMSANREESLKLAELHNTLLPMLMSGEIDVSKVNAIQ